MSLISVFLAARASMARRREQRRGYAELAALDDRSLADIGLHRSQIPAILEGLHEAVQFDSVPRHAMPAVNRRDNGITDAQEWLRSV